MGREVLKAVNIHITVLLGCDARCAPRIFRWGWGETDPEAIYNLFHFKVVIKIMS